MCSHAYDAPRRCTLPLPRQAKKEAAKQLHARRLEALPAYLAGRTFAPLEDPQGVPAAQQATPAATATMTHGDKAGSTTAAQADSGDCPFEGASPAEMRMSICVRTDKRKVALGGGGCHLDLLPWVLQTWMTRMRCVRAACDPLALSGSHHGRCVLC